MTTIDYLIQVTRLPRDLALVIDKPNNELFETANVYQVLVDSILLFKVWKLDEYDQVWVEVNCKTTNGLAEFHTIKLYYDTYSKVNYEEYQVVT